MSALVPVSSSDLATPDPVATVLALCSRARSSLAEARTIAEARNVWAFTRTIETAMKAQKIAGEAAVVASALRVDAERRVGELIRSERQDGRLASRGRPINVARPDIFPEPATLSDHGISRDQAAEYARLADAPADVYESAKAEVAETGRNVTRSAVLRTINPERERGPDERRLDAHQFLKACARLVNLSDAALRAVRFGAFPGEGAAPFVTTAALSRVIRAQEVLAAMRRELER